MISNSATHGDFDAIVLQDMCRVKYWGFDYFDVIFDLGANIGVFSMLMRMLHPKAKIIAVEPSLRTVSILESNLDHMHIDIDTRALGDGETMHLQYGRRRSPMGDWFCHYKMKRLRKASHPVVTVPFWRMFEDHGCSVEDKFFVKIDVEGGEQYLVGDKKSERVLVEADQVFLEVHFLALKNKVKYLPEFKVYEEWVNDVFSETHDIELFKLKIDRGFGHYCIRKKKE